MSGVALIAGSAVDAFGALGNTPENGGPAWVGAPAVAQEDPFPHADHQGLFPVCSGCHDGISTGDSAAFYPPPSQCVGCHDGVEEEEVTWNGPTSRVTNVVFDHAGHEADLQEAGDEPVTCEACHSSLDAGRMSVDEAEELETCWSCHAHERADHYDVRGGEECAVCHVPLAGSGFDRPRIEALPVPAVHEELDFVASGHGDVVQDNVQDCATCHTSDRCVACHVDASLPEIAATPDAPETMELPDWDVEYPVPATHEVSGFDAAHDEVEDSGECSTCHTSDDCASCHLQPLPQVASRLTSRAESVAPGAALEVAAPSTHESVFFLEAHPTLAASAPSECATCHTESYCVDCHDGAGDGGYHPPNFVSLHPTRAYGQSQECATCHNTAAFCRECHQEAGLGSQGRLGGGYHDAEPLFLLRHGQAARQNLESCASCHQQSDCVQCHGVLGSFQISPHTSDFDAEAAWARSPRTCLACHVANPLGEGP